MKWLKLSDDIIGRTGLTVKASCRVNRRRHDECPFVHHITRKPPLASPVRRLVDQLAVSEVFTVSVENAP